MNGRRLWSARDAVSVIERDPAIALRILQGVNAAANGLKREVSSVFEAVVLLGMVGKLARGACRDVALRRLGDRRLLADARRAARVKAAFEPGHVLRPKTSLVFPAPEADFLGT